METKICTKCGRELELKMFSHTKKTKLGLVQWCKDCVKRQSEIVSERNREWQNIHKLEIPHIKRVCRVCHQEKPLNEFNIKLSGKYGFNTRCKKCEALYKTEYAKKHKDKIKAYKELHKEELSEKEKIYRNTHKEQIKARCKKYREANKDLVIKWRNDWREKNKDRLRERERQRSLTRNKELLPYLRICLNRRIFLALKSQNVEKVEKINELLGCSAKECKEYLEKLFKPGMNWNNYGKGGWEIDHIIPCSAYDLREKEQRLKCFNYKNLQPLWRNENMAKKDFMPDKITKGKEVRGTL